MFSIKLQLTSKLVSTGNVYTKYFDISLAVRQVLSKRGERTNHICGMVNAQSIKCLVYVWA